MIGNSNEDTSFLQKSLLTDGQVSKLCKVLENNVSASIDLSKTQLSKIIQLGECLGRRLGPLLKTGLPLMKNLLKPLAESVLIPRGLIAAVLKSRRRY